MKYKPLLTAILIYLSVQVIGLYVGYDLLGKIQAEVIQPAVQNPESPYSSVQLLVYILVMTGVLILLLKFGLDILIKILVALSIFTGISITLWCIFGDYGFLMTILLIPVILWERKNISVMNAALILTITGIGSFLGASLAVLPAFLFLSLLAIYDLIAVFGTKHMVYLAEKGKGRFPFMFLIPFGKKNLGLGTGDLAIPLMFATSVLRDYALSNAVITALGGLAGLISLLFYIQGKKKITLPALPPVAIGSILGFGISLLF